LARRIEHELVRGPAVRTAVACWESGDHLEDVLDRVREHLAAAA
jgi:hypothetical protein